MKYVAAAAAAVIGGIIWILAGSGTLTCCFWCLTFLLMTAFSFYSEQKKEKELRELIGYLTRLQDGIACPELNGPGEGAIGILKSEIYKLIIYLQEQTGIAQKEKNYIADFLSDISHQIKTPLTAITLMTDLLQDPTLPAEKRKEFLSNIEKQTEKVTWLVRNLLTLSQLEAKQLHLKKETVCVKELLTEACRSVELLADAKGVTLEMTGLPDEKEILLECDCSWTGEALTNIIKNCVEHTPEGGTVAVAAMQHNLATVITIRDNGCGIPKEDLPHIFERFYKGKNGSKDSVGIGLAMAKQIFFLQDGIVEAVSEEGAGTTFTVRMYRTK